MPDQPHRIRILIASPSDVNAERKTAIESVRIWNAANSGVVLEAVDWETYAAPDGSKAAQEAINEQMVDRCDCAVGIFWTRIGTPTKVAPGGAVEELQRLEGMGRKTMVYFSNAPVPRGNKDYDQLKQVDDYREKREKESLCWSYDTVPGFEKEFFRHLSIQIPRWFPELFPSSQAPEKSETASDPAAKKADEKYREKLRSELNTISLLGSSVIQPFPLKLKDIFVPLEIYDESGSNGDMSSIVGRAGEGHALHWPEHVMRETFKRHSVMLVIGDPGSGKTTLMKYYALTCLDEHPPVSLGFNEPVRVFYLPLRELQTTESLSTNLSVWSENNYLAIEPGIFDAWLDGGVCLALLDGLDEVSDPKEREDVCRWIGKMSGAFGKAKFVVTSRPTVFRGEGGISPGFGHQRVFVRDFSHAQQVEFLNNWYRAAFLDGIRPATCTEESWESQQKGKAKNLTEAIVCYLQKPENKGIRELAAIPMLLQIMAILWKERKFLPGRRQELYSAALDYLLDYRDRSRDQEPLLCAEDARRVLSPVALWMQETLEEDVADRKAVQSKMQEKLESIRQPHSVEAICKNLVERAGVLVEHGKSTYVFRHKTFREYLAGLQLKEEWFEEGRMEMLIEHFGEKSGWWDEVILFFMGQSNEKLFDRFMKALFASSVSDNFTSKQKTLLSQVIEESPEKKSDALCRALLKEGEISSYRQRSVLETLKAIGQPKTLEALQTFRRKGLALDDDISELAEDVILFIEKSSGILSAKATKESGGKEVSPEDRSTLIRNPYEHDAQYILIPGGKYIFSVTEKEVSVPDLWFAKYPVTNRQYRSFIGFLGGKPVENTKALTVKAYKQALQKLANSGDNAVKGLGEYLKKTPDLVQRFRSTYDDDRKFNKDEQPVVGVRWFNARAYCLWLSMLSGEEYRLPTEREWEWAAGGRREDPGKVLKVKEYPWGDTPEPTQKHANFNANEGATTPVGRYPDGATPEGLYDMAGNVWEWVENWPDDDKDWKALRGGSWYYGAPEILRCAARDFDFPVIWDFNYIGFRVVRPSPVF